MIAILSLAILAAVSFVSCDDQLKTIDRCFLACTESFGSIMFSTSSHEEHGDYYASAIKDTLRWQSACLCSMKRCDPEEQEAGWEFYAKDFKKRGKITLPTCAEWTSTLNQSEIDSPYPVNFTDRASTTMINTTAAPEDDLFLASYRSWDDWIFVTQQHYNYSWAMLGFWVIVILIGLTNRIFAFVINHKAMRLITDPESGHRVRGYGGTVGKITALVRSKVILPAAFGYRHQKAFGWCTIPTRLQGLTIFIFFVINLVLCSVNYRANSFNIYWDTNAKQTWRYLADRTGIIAYANLPFLWLFSSRNNIAMLITGFNFNTFQQFHKWIARITVVEGIIHSVAYTVETWSSEGHAALLKEFKEQYWYTGVLATCAMSLMLGFSVYPLRQRLYEFFRYTHVAFAVITLVGLWYHTKAYGIDSYNGWFIWPSIAIWCFDYAVRIGRLIVLNYKSFFRRQDKAIAVYDSKHDMIRLTVFPSFHRGVEVGTHYFLHFPFTLALGNHPFTLSSWQSKSYDSNGRPLSLTSSNEVSTPTSIEKPLATTSTNATTESKSHFKSDLSSPSSLTFLIRPYRGLTRRLKNDIIKTGSNSKEIKVFIEGPYGQTHHLFNHPRVLFIAGGSGVTPVLSYMQYYLNHRSAFKRSLHPYKAEIATKYIHVVWAARQSAFAHSVLDNELHAAKARPDVNLDIFVTGHAQADQEDDLGLVEKPSKGLHLPKHVRPDVSALVAENVQAAREAGESLAVFVCGPATMADSVRAATVVGVASGVRVEYIEEQFGW